VKRENGRRVSSSDRLAEFKYFRIVRQIPATVFCHKDHVFDTHRPEARVIEAGLDRHDMSFLQQRTGSADTRRLVNIQSDAMAGAVKIALHAAVDQARLVPRLLETIADALVDGVLSVGGINTFGMVAVVLGILFCLVIGLTMREKMS